MRKIVWLLLLTLALPAVAFANSADFTNSGGTLSGSNSGLSLSGSTLIAINGPPLGLITGDFGSVTFSTGALATGSLQTEGTFAAGGSFVITGNGTDGIPNGVIFNGTFSGPVTWTLITLSNGTHNYTLTGALSGPGSPDRQSTERRSNSPSTPARVSLMDQPHSPAAIPISVATG